MRIITGKARGANLFTPKNYDVRPTADRVKESVFNIISSRIADAKVLDAFAGSGNLGLECWSRGAKEIVFLDKSRESLALVRRNVEKCRAAAFCRLLLGDAASLIATLAKQGEKFDLIFLDPPYAKGLITIALEQIVKTKVLKSGGLIVAERSSTEDEPLLPDGFTLLREEKYGATIIDFIGEIC